jgi:hypothetical protein
MREELENAMDDLEANISRLVAVTGKAAGDILGDRAHTPRQEAWAQAAMSATLGVLRSRDKLRRLREAD